MSDYLDTAEFKTAMKAYWLTSLHWSSRIDDIKELIRANYRPGPQRLQARIKELEDWIEKLTEKVV